MDSNHRARIARQFIEAIPHARMLGLRLAEIGAGRAVIEMDWAGALVGDPATGVLHGGAVSALMDTCGGAAVMSLESAPAGTATLDLRIDYMRAARPGEPVTAEAEVHHAARSVAFVRATARDLGEGLVATATGAFTLDWAAGRAPAGAP